MKTLIYLASPYSHVDAATRGKRFHAVNKAAAEMMSAGIHVFSPISHTHPIALAGGLPTGFDYWKDYDRAMLKCCKKLVVLMLDGWDQSEGVKAEVHMAEQLGLPVEYLNP